MNLSDVVWVGAVFLLAGGVKGLTGMGLPTVAVSLLVFWTSPSHAATLLVLPALLTNVAQCRGPHLRKLVATLWPAWLSMFLATMLVPSWADISPILDARRLLGWVLVLYGAWGLWRPALPNLSGQSTWLGVIAGTLTGWLTSLTAVFVMPLVPFVQSLHLEKDQMVQALGLSFTVATLALGLRLHGEPTSHFWSAGTGVATTAAFVGVWMGSSLRSRLSATVFQRSLFMVFIGLGIANIAWAANLA